MENEIKLEISDEGLKKAFGQALLSTLTEDARGKIISQAIEYVVQPRKYQYGQERGSILQESFEAAVADWSREFVRQYVQDDREVQAMIRSKLTEMVTELIQGEGWSAVKMEAARALADALVAR